MRIWCIPSSTRLEVESPLLPPRTDRDVFFRSPPPPPRLSRQEKLDRGVIVLKPKRTRGAKKGAAGIETASTSASVATLCDINAAGQQRPPQRRVHYADDPLYKEGGRGSQQHSVNQRLCPTNNNNNTSN